MAKAAGSCATSRDGQDARRSWRSCCDGAAARGAAAGARAAPERAGQRAPGAPDGTQSAPQTGWQGRARALIARDPKQRRRCGGTLIVAPTALVRHWRDELLRRAGGAGRAADEVTKKLCCLHDAYGFMFFDLHGREWGNNIESDRPPDVLVVSEERLSREFEASRRSATRSTTTRRTPRTRVRS